MSIKILWLSDSSVATNSGFGKVSLELLKRLSKNPNYEIAELGLANPTGTNYKYDPTWQVYLSGKMAWSQDVFVDVVKDFNPDIVISLLDIHMSAYINDTSYVPLEVRNTFKGIAHVPVDSAPLDIWGLQVLAGWNYIVPIHSFGKEVIQEGYSYLSDMLKDECKDLFRLTLTTTDKEDLELIENEIQLKLLQLANFSRANSNIHTINHGVDLETFSPCDEVSKAELRKKFGISDDSFVFVYFGRNSPRKQQPIVIKAFKEVLKDYHDSYLILGCKVVDVGWNLKEVIDREGLPLDRVLFTDNNSSVASEGLTDEQVANIYRVSDCFVTSSIAGGFELCNLESMAVGLPQIGIDGAGSITEMVKDHGILVESTKFWLGGEHGTGSRPLVDYDDFADAMRYMISDAGKDNREKWSKAAIEYSKREEFSWDFAAKEFEKIIDVVAKDESVAFGEFYK